MASTSLSPRLHPRDHASTPVAGRDLLWRGVLLGLTFLWLHEVALGGLAEVADWTRAQALLFHPVLALALWVLRKLLALDPEGRILRRRLGYRLEELDRLDGGAFEAWVATVLWAGGLPVRTTPPGGDYGVDLLVRVGPRCVAVEIKRRGRPIGCDVVRSIVAGAAHYDAPVAAIVTQSRFTAAARAQAARAPLPVLLLGREDLDALAQRLGEGVRAVGS